MINTKEVIETNEMIEKENLDVRTITMGISLFDCISSDLDTLNKNIYEKIYGSAKDLVQLPCIKRTDSPGLVCYTVAMGWPQSTLCLTVNTLDFINPFQPQKEDLVGAV